LAFSLRTIMPVLSRVWSCGCALMPTSLVDGLLGLRCPAAVVRRIGTVVVDAVDAVFPPLHRAQAHIRDEGINARHGVAPAVADGDAATPVIRVTNVAGVIAAGEHRTPDIPFAPIDARHRS